ncbi:hypothetical protein TNCV_3997941 [Trichonephila clavipes]|nr:hypothetical protein TNCV_3997941 [Trichonephila clavipes]
MEEKQKKEQIQTLQLRRFDRPSEREANACLVGRKGCARRWLTITRLGLPSLKRRKISLSFLSFFLFLFAGARQWSDCAVGRTIGVGAVRPTPPNHSDDPVAHTHIWGVSQFQK